ncbi:MAG: EpsI family protein [Acidobacteria bacterium]|nr:EpsI family protein [Acidobacteriota bacterium]
MFDFLESSRAKILTALLLAHAGIFYGMSRPEPTRVVKSLSEFPKEFGDWKMIQEGTLEKEEMEILKADEVITRYYANSKMQRGGNLFIAYFTTQRAGKAPHSPKNCLPGSGWMPLVNDKLYVDVEGAPPVEVNRYVVSRGDSKSLVLYWYQTKHRTVASEYMAKVYTVVDAIRYNRSDAAVVKVTLPVMNGDVDAATEAAKTFMRTFYQELNPYFP